MMYHDNPRRAEPATWMWYSVETPSVFKEYKLPVGDAHMTRAHHRQFAELRRLADDYGTSIHISSYRRG